MASDYPGGLDSFDTIAADKKTSDAVGGRTHRAMHNDLGDAIEAVQTELGTNPSGSESTVVARLDKIEDGTRLGANSVGATQLADNAVDTNAIADSAVTSAKIADGTIVDADINASAAIARTKIAGTALTTSSTGVFSVLDYGAHADGVADDTAHINAALTAGSGAVVVIPAGTYKIADTLAVPAGTELRLHNGADIRPVDPEVTAVTLAAGSTLTGGTITSDDFWDGENVGGWTYAVIRVEGDDVTVKDVNLVNVARAGIGIDQHDDVTISGCRIDGGYTDALWADDDTASVHFGIALDPGAGDTRGNLVITGNIIKRCVQGVFIGNYGAGDWARGVSIVGNTFEDCHNHGCYTEYTWGATITGNTFNRCAGGIITGLYSVVSGNAMTTRGTGLAEDQPLISVRNPTGCVVANNTIKGECGDGGVVIDLSPLHDDVTERTDCRDNIVVGNVVDVTGGSSRGIRVGSGVMTTCDNNIIRGNVVKAPGTSGYGVVSVGDSLTGVGNDISGNTIVGRGLGGGIHLMNQQDARVSGNEVRLEYDAETPSTIGLVYLVGCTDTLVGSNRLIVTEDWGTDITVRGVWEASGTTGTRIERNWHSYDPTKITASQNLTLIGDGAAFIDETGTGAPAVAAAAGSVWRRTDSSPALSVKDEWGWSPVGIRESDNLLSPNAASGGDWFGATTGFTDTGHPTIRTYITTDAKRGDGCIKTVLDSGSAPCTGLDVVGCVAGETFYAAIWLNCAGTAGGHARLQLTFKDVSGTAIGYAYGSYVAAADGWAVSEISAVTPASTASITVIADASSFSVSDFYLLDAGILHRGDGVDRQPGAIAVKSWIRPNPANTAEMQLWNTATSAWVTV